MIGQYVSMNYEKLLYKVYSYTVRQPVVEWRSQGFDPGSQKSDQKKVLSISNDKTKKVEVFVKKYL